MKLNTAVNLVERDGVQMETAFTIKATAHSFEILSSGLYSNKPLAIIRELSCNARDSHVAAGKSDVPFEIKLPNSLDPTFYVKDFGTGLTCEQVENLYTTYFESTKTQSDDFIGQLGLGSKSPFSYADTFTVESRYKGVRSIYTCFKNEQGLPSIAKMGEEPMQQDEQNGLTIGMSIKAGDYDKFRIAAQEALTYFDVKPNVIGDRSYSHRKVEYSTVTNEWGMRKSGGVGDGIYVIQGGVAYPVDVSVFAEDYPTLTKLSGINCDLFMPIGSVDVAASREALQYKKRTIANIASILTKVNSELVGQIQAKLDACESDWDRKILFGKIYDDSSDYRFYRLFRETIAGQLKDSAGNPMSLRINKFKTNIGIVAYKDSSTGVSTIKELSDFTPTDKTVVIRFDTTKNRKQMAKAIMEQNRAIRTVIVLCPDSENPQAFNTVSVNDLLKQWGNPKLFDYSHIVLPKTSTYVKRAPEMRLVFTGFDGAKETFSRNTWIREKVCLTDGGVYVKTSRFTPETQHAFVKVLKAFEVFNIPMPRLIGLTDVEVAKVVHKSNWVELFDYLKQQFALKNANHAVDNAIGACRGVLSVGKYNVQSFVNAYGHLRPLLTNTTFTHLADQIEVGYQQYNKHNGMDQWHTRYGLDVLGLLDETYINEMASGYQTVWTDMLNVAPMLQCITWDNVSNHVGMISGYINDQAIVDSAKHIKDND